MNNIVSSGFIAALLLATAGCDNGPTNAEAPAAPQQHIAQPIQSAAPVPATTTVTHPNGETVVNNDPKRIVTLDFGTLDTLNELELGDRVVAFPRASIPEYLSEYRGPGYSNAGTMKEPDFDAIRQLNPDLIVMTGRQGKSYDQLAQIAPTVNLGVDGKNYLDSIKHNVRIIGQLFNKEADVEQAIGELDGKISNARSKSAASDLKALVIMHNADKLSAANTGAYATIIHDLAGIKRADADLEQKRRPIDEAYLTQVNPDVIFIVDRSAAIGQGQFKSELLAAAGAQNVEAYKNDRIVYLKPDLWYLSGGGLESLSLQLEEALAALD